MSESSWFSDPAYTAGLDQLAALQATAARTFAAEARVLVELTDGATHDGWRGSAPFDSVLLEVAGTCVIGQQSAGARLADAQHLVTFLPETFGRLQAGTLGVPQARVLISETRHLDALTCSQVEKRVLLVAAELPPGRLRDRVRRLVLTLDAAEAARRAARARADRKVWTRHATEDGMSLLVALLPAEHVAAVQLSLTEQAHALHTAGDPRTIEQLRADLVTELLTGRRIAPTGPDLPPATGATTVPAPVLVEDPPWDQPPSGPGNGDSAPSQPLASPCSPRPPTRPRSPDEPTCAPACDPTTGEVTDPTPATAATTARSPTRPASHRRDRRGHRPDRRHHRRDRRRHRDTTSGTTAGITASGLDPTAGPTHGAAATADAPGPAPDRAAAPQEHHRHA